MKILNKYRFIKGAKGDKAPVPRLVPPDRNQNLMKSMSISHSVDALCEGPIYGLVDQFGRKVYGLDMLKGIYLNKVPAMNSAGEYNFRNILMEINLGTENQKPLANFNKVYIYKPANFKLLGKINPNEEDVRPVGRNYTGPELPKENFTSWAKGQNGWPDLPQDPFIYVHHIRNKDVKKIQIAFIIEQLSDTVSEGKAPGEAGKMGMNKRSSVELMVRYGLEGSKVFTPKRVVIDGLVLSPCAYMVGEEASTLDGAAGPYANPSTFGGSVFNTAGIPSINTSKDSRILNAVSSEEALRRMVYQEPL
jgi:hypothetical protein